VSYCLITDGDAGGFDPDVPRGEIAGIRQAEQRRRPRSWASTT
jgi:LmbE family N-acetylglucosaminyl deacetylase